MSNIIRKLINTAALGTVAYGAIGYYCFDKIFHVDNSYFKGAFLMDTEPSLNEWYLSLKREDHFITSRDQLRLHATFIPNGDSKKWILMHHGYISKGSDMKLWMKPFYERGYNIVLVDARACGMSEGIYTSMGWLEHYDVLDWLSYLNDALQPEEIVLFGISMGANTIMNTCGEALPENVICAIEDCGYIDTREELLYEIQKIYKVDGSILMPVIDKIVQYKLGFSLDDANTKNQLMKANVPMLFVHGDKDKLVPFDMMWDCYYACASEKEYFVAKGKEHGHACSDDGYFNAIFTFIEKHSKNVV